MNIKKNNIRALILKIIGFIGFAVSISGVIVTINTHSIAGIIMIPFGFFVGVSCLVSGFAPTLNDITIKYAEKNKETFSDFMKIFEKPEVFCEYCGCKMNKDDTTCSHCGSSIKE